VDSSIRSDPAGPRSLRRATARRPQRRARVPNRRPRLGRRRPWAGWRAERPGSASPEATHDRYELGDRPASAEAPIGDFEADEDSADEREGTVEDVARPRGAKTRGIGWK
jgi:hypothetical protein